MATASYFAALCASPLLDRFALAAVSVQTDPTGRVKYVVAGVRRWQGVLLSVVMNDTTDLLRQQPLPGATLILERTHLGESPVRLLRESVPSATVRVVTVSSGEKATTVEGALRIPLVDLTAVLRLTLESRRLEMPTGLAEPETLERELQAFGSANGDPLAVGGAGLAIALSLWAAERDAASGETVPLEMMSLHGPTDMQLMERMAREGLVIRGFD